MLQFSRFSHRLHTFWYVALFKALSSTGQAHVAHICTLDIHKCCVSAESISMPRSQSLLYCASLGCWICKTARAREGCTSSRNSSIFYELSLYQINQIYPVGHVVCNAPANISLTWPWKGSLSALLCIDNQKCSIEKVAHWRFLLTLQSSFGVLHFCCMLVAFLQYTRVFLCKWSSHFLKRLVCKVPEQNKGYYSALK